MGRSPTMVKRPDRLERGFPIFASRNGALRALHPPHLSAVVLWEGWNDYYRRFYKGGIPETTFMWWLGMLG